MRPARAAVHLGAVAAALCVAACAEPPPARKPMGDSRFWAPYREIADIYETFEAIPADRRSLLKLSLNVEPTGKARRAEALVFTLVGAGPRSRFGVGTDGALKFPRGAALSAGNPDIYVNLPVTNRVIITIDGLFDGDQVRPIPAPVLRQFVIQARDAVAAQAGVWGMFVPKPDGIAFRSLHRPATITLLAANGDRVEHRVTPGDRPLVVSDDTLAATTAIDLPPSGVEIAASARTPITVTVDSESQ